MSGLDGLAVSQLTEFLRVKASLKNSGHEPNQPLSVSDELSKHLQPTKPHPYYIYAMSFLFFSLKYLSCTLSFPIKVMKNVFIIFPVSIMIDIFLFFSPMLV